MRPLYFCRELAGYKVRRSGGRHARWRTGGGRVGGGGEGLLQLPRSAPTSAYGSTHSVISNARDCMPLKATLALRHAHTPTLPHFHSHSHTLPLHRATSRRSTTQLAATPAARVAEVIMAEVGKKVREPAEVAVAVAVEMSVESGGGAGVGAGAMARCGICCCGRCFSATWCEGGMGVCVYGVYGVYECMGV